MLIQDLQLSSADSPEGKFIQAFVMLEAAQNCQPLNQDDNKKTLKKYKKEDIKPWFTKYASTSRTLYRGCWLYDFLHMFIVSVCQDRETMMSKLAQAAYTKALAPYHPWVLKKAAGVAMKAVKRRDKFVASVVKDQKTLPGKDGYDEEKLYADFLTLGE